MQALTALTLSHFRSHKFSTITCDARPVALTGPNGAGKTNVLEAVSLFSPGRGLRRSSAQDMTRRPEALGWKLTGLLASFGQMHEIETWSEGGAARQVTPPGLRAWQSSFSPDGSQLVFTAQVGERRQLHRIDADGSNLVNISANDAEDFAAHWGPELHG